MFSATTISAYPCFGSGALVHAAFACGLCVKVWGLPKHRPQLGGSDMRQLQVQLDPRENDCLPGEGRA